MQQQISVLLPVGPGAETHLGPALASLAAQRGPAFEVLLVDDRAGPAARRMFPAGDRRFRVLRTEGEGLVAALRTGLAAAGAPIVARFDADDLARPGRLAAQLAAFEADPELALVGTRVALLSGGEGYRRFVDWQNALINDEQIRCWRFAECPIAHPTWAFRADLVRVVGGYRDEGWPEDLDLLLRLSEAGCKLGKLPEVLHDWRDCPQRLSRVDPRYRAEAFARCRAHYLARALPGLADGRPVLVWGAGREGGRLGRLLLDAGRALAGFVDIDPRKIGGLRHGLPVHDGRSGSELQHDRPFILAAVGGDGGRLLHEELSRRGLTIGRDWLPVAAPR